MFKFLILWCILTIQSFGLIIDELPFYHNVGKIGQGSGIYIGNGVVLTAAHVGCYPFIVGDTTYTPRLESWKILSLDEDAKSDLAIFTLTTLPPLPSIEIEDVDKSDILVFGGYGYISPNKKGNILGNTYTSKREKLFGYNYVDVVNKLFITAGPYRTRGFTTSYDYNIGDSQATAGDSGGGAFQWNKSDKKWKLVGCIIGVSQYDATVPYGTRTYFANLSFYKKQILP